MSESLIITSELPAVGDGVLSEFSINVRAQRILLTAYCRVAGYPTYVTIRAEFEGVVHLAMVNDNPIVLSRENGMDRFEELPDSDLIRWTPEQTSPRPEPIALDERNGWQFLISGFGTSTIGSPKKNIELRSFVINSSFLSAKWLCQSATFELIPETE